MHYGFAFAVAIGMLALTGVTRAAQCPGPVGKDTVSQVIANKQAFAVGHYALAQRQSAVLLAVASSCIANGIDVDDYHYIHAFSGMIDAQARLAMGDANGVVQFQAAAKEADALANNPSADPTLRGMAKNMVDGERYVLNELLRAKKGQIIHPPPTPTP